MQHFTIVVNFPEIWRLMEVSLYFMFADTAFLLGTAEVAQCKLLYETLRAVLILFVICNFERELENRISY